MVDIYNIISILNTEGLTPFFIIGSIVEVLVAGFVFRMALKIAGAEISFKKAILFSILVKSINLITSLFVPAVFYGFYVFTLNSAIWLLLVMKIYRLSFTRAAIVAITQLIITFIFTIIGIPMFIQYLELGVII